MNAGRVARPSVRAVARVGHGVEAHQDVRQAGGAEHQREAERDRVERIGDQLARRQHAGAVRSARRREERERVEAEPRQHQQREQRARRPAAAPPSRSAPRSSRSCRRTARRRASPRRRSRPPPRTAGRTAAGSGCRRRPSARSGRTRRPRACRSPRRCAPASGAGGSATTSANVYLPRLRSGSAIRNITTGQPTSKPIE